MAFIRLISTKFILLMVSIVPMHLLGVSCSQDGTFRTVDGRAKGYYFNNLRKMNWSEAVDYCAANGMQLVSVQSEAEQEFIASRIERVTKYDIAYVYLKRINTGNGKGNKFIETQWWTSGNDMASEGEFVWLGEQKLGYTSWDEGEPNSHNGWDEDCLELRIAENKTKWNDAPCRNPKHFICEYYITQYIKIDDIESLSESTTSSVTQYDRSDETWNRNVVYNYLK